MADATGASEAVGMPQLDFAAFPNQIFWLIVTLVVIYLILSRVALPRIGAVIAERRGTITNDIARAEELNQKAEEAEAAYQKALADARAEAHKIIEKARVEMQEELDLALQKADSEIAARTAESERRIAEVRDSAAEAIEIVARDTAAEVLIALGQSSDAAVVDAAVTEALRQGGTA